MNLCKRCGHDWKPRIKTKPRMCPKCKSRYWDCEEQPKSGPKKRYKDEAD